MNRFSLSVCLVGPLLALGCAEKVISGEGYELSDVENDGESLDGDDEDSEAEDTGTDEADDDSDDSGEPEEDPIDERTYAQQLVVSMLMPGVFNPDNYEEMKTTSLLLVDWVRDGTEVTWTEELCHISSTEAHGAQTSFPSAFVSSMPIRENTAILSAPEVGADFRVEAFVNVDGASLDNPSTDSLPSSEGDGRLRDQDSDGQPGVTVHIDAGWPATGDVYLAQRSVYSYEGLVVDHDRVEAYVDYSQEQSIIGSSNSVLTLREVIPVPNPDPTTSYVIFQEVEAGTSCGDIKRDRDELF